MGKTPIDADKTWNIVNKIYKGYELKNIGWTEGVSYSTVTNTRDRYPLFCWNKDKSDD